MGIGDLGVGKRIKGMAEGFFGRMEAYEKGLDDAQELQNALKRNLFRKSSPSPSQVSAMAAYVQTEAARLDTIDMETLLAGNIEFAPPAEDKARQP